MYILFLEEDLVLYAWIDDVCKNKLTIFEGAESVWISFAGLPGRHDYLEISTQDPGITILGSQLTGLADWLCCHIITKLIFVAFS